MTSFALQTENFQTDIIYFVEIIYITLKLLNFLVNLNELFLELSKSNIDI